MICLLCQKISLSIICKKCQKTYLQPSIKKKEIITNFFVYSFYDYEDIKELIYTKYDSIGSQIYSILAKNSFSLFAKKFDIEKDIYAIGLDDNPSKGYSHSAILAKSLESTNIKPLYNTLRARNNTKFANKDYAFRLANPRNFIYKKPLLHEVKKVILVDDIITSALSILEAKDCITRHNINPLFGLVLCNLQD